MLPESSLYLEDKKFLKWRIFKNFAIVQDRLYILTSKSVLILEKSALDSSRYDYKTCYSGLSSNFEDLVVDSEYNCYISDSKNNTIVRLNLNGEFKSEISQIAGISINKPTSLCLISEALFVLNSGDRRILKIKLKNNKYEKQFVFHRQFCDMIVKQICADGSGNIYFHAENSLYKILNQESR